MLRRSATPLPQSGPESQALLQSLESSFTIRRRPTVTETLSSIGYIPTEGDKACPVPLRVAVEVRAPGTGQLMSAELAFTFGWTSARSQ